MGHPFVGRKVLLVDSHPVGFKNRKWTCETTETEVRVMAVAEGYAMVRHPGCIPFVARLKDLRERELDAAGAV